MSDDPRVILSTGRMTGRQIAAVAVCVLLNAMDGFDVLSISFASPGIAKDWGIDRAALGVVLSMELIGMSLGSVLISRWADSHGRRPIILFSLGLMALGMFLASTASGLVDLSIYRVMTGLGIGAMLASINAMAAEFANEKNRGLAVTVMASGYPVGAILGGMVASYLLTVHSWRAVFVFGGIATVCFIPLVVFLLPESVHFLTGQQPKKALQKVNRILSSLGHKTVAALPDVSQEADNKVGFAQLFKPAIISTTLLLTAAYFFHIMTFYYTIKWIPKILVDFGFAPSSAGGVLVWANVGGALGAITLGTLSKRFSLRRLTMGALLVSFLGLIVFGQQKADLAMFTLVAASVGFFTNGAIVGLYAMFAEGFPTSLRAGGTGFVIGVGRGGAALGPIIAGYLFTGGYGLSSVSLLMGAGSFLAFVAIVCMRAPKTANGEGVS